MYTPRQCQRKLSSCGVGISRFLIAVTNLENNNLLLLVQEQIRIELM